MSDRTQVQLLSPESFEHDQPTCNHCNAPIYYRPQSYYRLQRCRAEIKRLKEVIYKLDARNNALRAAFESLAANNKEAARLIHNHKKVFII